MLYQCWLLVFGECLIDGFSPFLSFEIPGFRALLTFLTSLHQVEDDESSDESGACYFRGCQEQRDGMLLGIKGLKLHPPPMFVV